MATPAPLPGYLDVSGDGGEPAFTATGLIVRFEPSADLFATFEFTAQVELERLQHCFGKLKGWELYCGA